MSDKNLRDAINQAVATGGRPSPSSMQEFSKQNREKNAKFQARVAANHPHGSKPSVSRQDWFAAMALQALIQAEGSRRHADGAIQVAVVSLDDLDPKRLAKIAKEFAQAMIED